MVPDFARRPSATGAALCFALIVAAVGCGDAVTTPFFAKSTSNQGGSGGTALGGASGDGTGGATGGSVVGGDAGIGGATAGDAGTAGLSGTSGDAGSGALGGTGPGGMAGSSGSGMSGSDTGGTGGVMVDCTAADPSAVSYEEHCYVHRATARTWMAARDDCSAQGAHLVIIESEGRSEDEFLAENEFVWMLGGATEVWIGATDGRQSNQPGDGTLYAWINGQPTTFDNWSTGEPNNSRTSCMANVPCSCGDVCWEHCGFMWDPDNDEPGTWNDRNCEHIIGYVCEWDDPPT
jgi:hypothetical protein